MGSDFEKADAYVNSATDYEELPELMEDFARGEIKIAGQPVKPKRGRPTAGSIAKQQITLRLDPDVIEKFKATGAGWQSRMNDVLRAWTGKKVV